MIAKRDPGDTLGFAKETGKKHLERLHARLEELQPRLYAEGRRSVLLVLQGIDASGKDGVI
ncbi:MAG TPA: polyphosphate kinase 2 family protein, partial [Gaiellaceae bacterium]